MTCPEWWMSEGLKLFSDFPALRANPYSFVEKVWNKSREEALVDAYKQWQEPYPGLMDKPKQIEAQAAIDAEYTVILDEGDEC